MKTKITNAADAMEALSENFEALITGKRKPDIAREVTNNIGKMINIKKTQVVDKLRTGDKRPIAWLDDEPAISEEGKKLLDQQKQRDGIPMTFNK